MIRINSAALEYSDIITGKKDQFALVVDETRQTSRYRGVSGHFIAKMNVIFNGIIEKKSYLTQNFGKIRSDLLGHIEKVLKIRLVYEILCCAKEVQESQQSQEGLPLLDVFTQDELLEKLQTSSASELYSAVLVFDQLDRPSYLDTVSSISACEMENGFLTALSRKHDLFTSFYSQVAANDININSVLKIQGLRRKSFLKIQDLFPDTTFSNFSYQPHPNNPQFPSSLVDPGLLLYNGNLIFGQSFPTNVFIRACSLVNPAINEKIISWAESLASRSKGTSTNTLPLFMCFRHDTVLMKFITQLFKLNQYVTL
ncbi:hypothetical protein BB560_003853 [Smittium megazygosporum]|nr:hypothetical protein BB560_003853 [Smittium megazygosporum]